MSSEVTIWRAMAFKPDLLNTTPFYLDFLHKCASYPSLVSEKALKRILYRYEHMWLPLASEWFQTELEPPLDIKWMWHVHMLHPKLYVDYCMNKFRRILPHRIRISEAAEQQAHHRAKLIWHDKYPSEPFDLDLQSINPGTYQTNGTKLMSLLRDAAMVMDFSQQVSMPHFRDATFLAAALNRYKQLLILKKSRPDARIAPPIDILLMWRLHALHPVEYHNEAFRPYKLYSLSEHVDFNGRCLLEYGYNDSEWSFMYQDPLLVPGSAYRGVRDFSLMQTLQEDTLASPTRDKCDIVIDNLTVNDVWSRDKKLVIVVRLLGKSSFTGTEILRLETTVGRTNTSPKQATGEGLASFSFDSKDNRGVEFNIFAIRGACGCTKAEVHLNTMLFNPKHPFGESSFSSKDFVYEIPKVSHVDPKVSFQCRLRAAPPQPHVFSLERKPLKPHPLPKEIIPHIKELPKWRDAIAKESLSENSLDFTSATHSLKDRENTIEFKIEVVKQNDLDLGAVLVRQEDDSVLVTAQTVSEETLASPQQLTRKCPVNLDLEGEELAMLISNRDGEWAICKAKWESENDEGRVKITVFFLKSHKDLAFYIRDDEMQAICFGDVTIDMPTGRISVDSRNLAIAENIALAFSVGVLYVSCQVRATLLMSNKMKASTTDLTGSIRSAKSFDLEASLSSSKVTAPAGTPKFNVRRRNKKHTRKRKMSASFTFLLATGLQIDVTLYGSTGKSQRPVSRASLASIHLLYERSASSDSTGMPASPQSYLSDARNNNTAYSNNSSVRSREEPPQKPEAFQSWETTTYFTGGSTYYGLTNGRPASSAPVTNIAKTAPSYSPPHKDGDTDSSQMYMDVRL